ncbi:hypothetical protein AZI87_16505 [Bdellovibrio bacteriovorus]|uniref:Uncharacterized protein n=1 Tax=Bdellovibrio bacteriovorus TaxID=959 RepID=A0A162FZI6_BDEBC|nr:hypothetical protein [Bdellovibrio bacteriovorus]KYG62869.1 hypothetical protein AZI87_16505 [Bdellovibrio bacteriovorus]
MPEIKHYDGKKKHSSKGGHKKAHHHDKHAPKRRPHHEMEADEALHDEENIEMETAAIMNDAGVIVDEAEVTIEEADAINTEAQNEGVRPEEITVEAHRVSDEDTSHEDMMSSNGEGPQKVHLEFYGSELIRMKAPKVMELADTVADEWVHDGQFEGLPVGHPLAQMAAAKALRTAKDVEKKLEEKGVFVMAKMGLDYVKSKIDKK